MPAISQEEFIESCRLAGMVSRMAEGPADLGRAVRLARNLGMAIDEFNRHAPAGRQLKMSSVLSRILDNDPDRHRTKRSQRVRPTTNPGIFTIQDVATEIGVSVGDLLEEQPETIGPAYRELLGALNQATASDREEIVRHAVWAANRMTDPVSMLRFPVQTNPESTEYTFLIPPEEFIERDHDYPRALHVFTVPEAQPIAAQAESPAPMDGTHVYPFAAGDRGLMSVQPDPLFPNQAAQIVHSLRDAYNHLIPVIRVRGNSMREILHDGDLVAVDTTLTTPENGDVVAIYIKGEGGMLGLWNKQGDEYSLVKENPDFDRVPLGQPGCWLLWGTVTQILQAPLRRKRK